ncbi:TPA: hypothetical protein DIC21_05655 [Candidatus Uhrbacteria bacterium]|nr:hypothetical protein [Candidatus Uhrbacteria bacterium]
MEKKINKKTTTVVIIVLAVVIIAGGAYYGFNRWRQQRLVNDYYQAIYGTVAPGIGGLLGSGAGGLSAETIGELVNLQAEFDAEEAANEAEEMAKTPAQKYNEAEEAYLSGNTSPLFDQVARSDVEAIYKKCKIIASTFGYFGGEGFAVQVMVPEKVTAESFDKLAQRFTDQGYISTYGEITADSGMVMLENTEGVSLTINFDTTSDEQGITIMYYVNE